MKSPILLIVATCMLFVIIAFHAYSMKIEIIDFIVSSVSKNIIKKYNNLLTTPAAGQKLILSMAEMTILRIIQIDE